MDDLKAGFVLVVLVILVLAGIRAADSATLDDLTPAQLCVYKSTIAAAVAHLNNENKPVTVAWRGDETDFERRTVQEYIAWANNYFIPKYRESRRASGKPADYLIVSDVLRKAYDCCKEELQTEQSCLRL